MTYTTNGPTQLVEIAPHVFLGCRISRIEGLSPERQLMQTYMMDNHEGKDIEYRGLISFSAEDADSVCGRLQGLLRGRIEGLIREERQRRLTGGNSGGYPQNVEIPTKTGETTETHLSYI